MTHYRSSLTERVEGGKLCELTALSSLSTASLCVILRAQGRALEQPEGGMQRKAGFHTFFSNCGYFELPIGEYPTFDEIQEVVAARAIAPRAVRNEPPVIHAEYRAFAERMYAEALAWIDNGPSRR